MRYEGGKGPRVKHCGRRVGPFRASRSEWRIKGERAKKRAKGLKDGKEWARDQTLIGRKKPTITAFSTACKRNPGREIGSGGTRISY